MDFVKERHDICSTDTQWVVQLSGYAWALQQLAGEDHREILDAACGTGFGTSVLARSATHAVGVDLSHDAIFAARTAHRAANLAFLVMDVARLAFSNGCFDAVISQDTIEHVLDDERFVTEVARILKSTGTFVVFTPYREVHTTRPENPYHLREYSPESLCKLLQANFSSVRLFGRRPSPSLKRVEGTLDEVRRYDPCGIRLLVPRVFRHWLGSLWLGMRGEKVLNRVSVGDVEYVEGVPQGCTTLIAVCRVRA